MSFLPPANGRAKLDLSAHKHANERSAVYDLEIATRKQIIVPWSDGTGEQIERQTILPEGAVVGTPVDIPHGWEYPVTGSPILNKIQVVDFVNTRGLPIWEGVESEGMKELWWMSPAAPKDDGDGWWRPKRIQVSSNQPFKACLQPDLRASGHSEQVESVPYSIAYYGADGKHGAHYRNGVLWKPYHTGKQYHSWAPTAWFWDGNRLIGTLRGRLEWDEANQQEVKAFDMALVAPLLVGCTEISVDAVVGYDTMGATRRNTGSSVAQYGGPYNIGAGAGTIVSVTCGAAVDSIATNRVGIYDNSGGAPGSLYANSDTTQRIHDADEFVTSSKYWLTWNYGGAQPVTGEGELWIMMNTQSTLTDGWYDASVGFSWRNQNSVNPAGAAPDPAASFQIIADIITSQYVTTESGGGGGASLDSVAGLGVALGLGI